MLRNIVFILLFWVFSNNAISSSKSWLSIPASRDYKPIDKTLSYGVTLSGDVHADSFSSSYNPESKTLDWYPLYNDDYVTVELTENINHSNRIKSIKAQMLSYDSKADLGYFTVPIDEFNNIHLKRINANFFPASTKVRLKIKVTDSFDEETSQEFIVISKVALTVIKGKYPQKFNWWIKDIGGIGHQCRVHIHTSNSTLPDNLHAKDNLEIYLKFDRKVGDNPFENLPNKVNLLVEDDIEKNMFWTGHTCDWWKKTDFYFDIIFETNAASLGSGEGYILQKHTGNEIRFIYNGVHTYYRDRWRYNTKNGYLGFDNRIDNHETAKRF